METLWLLFGMGIGFVIGTGYIPHQLKKKNPKVIQQVKELLKEYDVQ